MRNMDYEQLVIYLRRAQNYIHKQMNDALQEFEISRTHVGILFLLSKNELGYSMTEISNFLCFDNAIITRRIKELERLNYVTRTGDAKTSRKYHICLTEKGKIVAKAAKEQIALREQEFISMFTQEERELFEKTCDLFIQKLLKEDRKEHARIKKD